MVEYLSSLRPPALLSVTRSTCHFLLERPLNFADNLQFCRRRSPQPPRHRTTANPDFKTLSQLVVCRPASLQSFPCGSHSQPVGWPAGPRACCPGSRPHSLPLLLLRRRRSSFPRRRPSVRPSSARRLPFVKMEDSLAGLPIARCGSDVRGSWLRSSAQEISEIDPSIIEQ